MTIPTKILGICSSAMGISTVSLLPASVITSAETTPLRSIVKSALTGPAKGLGMRMRAVSPGA
jgi:hypothetical protein